MQDEWLSVPDSKVMRNAKPDFPFIRWLGSCSPHKTSHGESVQNLNLTGNHTTQVDMLFGVTFKRKRRQANTEGHCEDAA